MGSRRVRIDQKCFQTRNNKSRLVRNLVLNIIRLNSNKIENKNKDDLYKFFGWEALIIVFI